MAGEIKIALNIWSHRVDNPNGVWSHLNLGTGYHCPKAWLLPATPAVDLNAGLSEPIPTYIHATPNAKIRLRWATDSADVASAVRFFVFAKHLVPNTTALNGAWGDSIYVDDVSNGQYVMNEVDLALVNAIPADGRDLRFVLRRNKPGTAEDTLAATVYLLEAFLIADKAA